MATVRLARDLRNGWGVGVPFDVPAAPDTATKLAYLGTRWVRQQFSGDNSAAMTAVQAQLVSQGAFDPNLKLNLLLNGYNANANTNTLANQQSWIMNSLINVRGPNGTQILKAIENLNECNNPNTGQGSRGPNDQTDKTGTQGPGGPGSQPNPVADANFVDWHNQVSPWMDANTPGVEKVSGTVIYFLGANFPSDLNVDNLVNFGCAHDYGSADSGTGGVPSSAGNPGNLWRTYHYAQAGISPSKPMVFSEFGATTAARNGCYSLRGQARYFMLALLDLFACGCHRAMVYNLTNNPASTQGSVTIDPEDNFGIFWPDGTPKPSGIALGNFQDLVSLGNDRNGAANPGDTAAFTPAYDGSTLTVTGVANAGDAGSVLVLPKSDGSTMITVRNQPPIETGNMTSTTPAANAVHVDFGASHSYRLWDVMGAGNVADFTAARGPVMYGSGTGSTVDVTLYGTPVFIELLASGSPVAPPPPTPPTITLTPGVLLRADGTVLTLGGRPLLIP